MARRRRRGFGEATLVRGEERGSTMQTTRGRNIDVPLPEGIRTYRVLCKGRMTGIAYAIATREGVRACIDAYDKHGELAVTTQPCRTFDTGEQAENWLRGKARLVECDD